MPPAHRGIMSANSNSALSHADPLSSHSFTAAMSTPSTKVTSAASSKVQLVPRKVVGIVFVALVCDLLAFTMPRVFWLWGEAIGSSNECVSTLPDFPSSLGSSTTSYRRRKPPGSQCVFRRSRRPNHAHRLFYKNETLLSHTLSFVRTLRKALFSYSSLAPLSEVANSRWDLTLLGGLLASLFSLCQFIISPHLGALSDRYGRRPVLLFSMAGNLLSGVFWVASNTFGIYAISRIIGGLSEGNVQLSIAVISDVTSPETRSKSLALVGVAFSIAFTLGPSLGAYFASRTLGKGSRINILGNEIELNGYAVPAMCVFLPLPVLLLCVTDPAFFRVTLALLVIETAYLAACLPETRWYKEGKEEEKNDKKVEPTGPPRTFAERQSRLKELQWIHLWFLYFFSGLSVFPFDVGQASHPVFSTRRRVYPHFLDVQPLQLHERGGRLFLIRLSDPATHQLHL